MKRYLAVGCLFGLWLFPALFYSADEGLLDFKSDGCSLFPDGTFGAAKLWCDCCLQHDLAYWQGGTEAYRQQADLALKNCVLARTSNAVLANSMYQGVRFGGHPVFPNWYRWGYGWSYGRGYQALSAEEQQQVADKLAQYEQGKPVYICN